MSMLEVSVQQTCELLSLSLKKISDMISKMLIISSGICESNNYTIGKMGCGVIGIGKSRSHPDLVKDAAGT